MAAFGRRRASLFETINRLREEDDEVISQLIKEINKEEVEICEPQWHSTPTREQQDSTLRDYEAYCRLMKFLPEESENLSEAQKDLMLFPADHEKLYIQLRG